MYVIVIYSARLQLLPVGFPKVYMPLLATVGSRVTFGNPLHAEAAYLKCIIDLVAYLKGIE